MQALPLAYICSLKFGQLRSDGPKGAAKLVGREPLHDVLRAFPVEAPEPERHDALDAIRHRFP